MMFEEGTIIYFNSFYFKNGNKAKPKYFVILKNLDSTTIIASLPTRKDYIPSKYEVEKGCVEVPESNLNCFVISSSCMITVCGKSFAFATFLYGHEIDDYSNNSLIELYPNKNIDYRIWGTMNPHIFEEMIRCFKISKSVKFKYRRVL